MPKSTSTEEQNIGFAPVFAQASAEDIPLPFHQAISEVPEGIKSTVLPPAVKFTSGSITKLIKRNAIVATHWYNLPLVDGLRSVASIYKVVAAAAFNYQRTHQDAFFEAYPELLIKKSTEGTTTSDLRRDYKIYARRIAHYWYEYGEAKKMQLGALINLLTLTRLNGNETMKKIASDVRWSRINTSCVLAERFPSPKGLEAYVTSKSRYATGKTTFGADIVSIGLWKTDVLGTANSKDIPLDNVTIAKADGSGSIPDLSQYDNGDPDLLIDAMTVTLHQFANAYTDSISPFGQPVTAPEIENGKTRYIAEGTDGIYFRLNKGVEDSAIVGKFGVTSALTKRLWALYDMWTNYLTFAFSDMMDPNNDKYTYAVNELHIIEPSSKNEDLLKTIRSLDNFDIVSLAQLMTYKIKNSVNSATVVKFAPAFYDATDASHLPFEDDNLIDLNTNRYPVESSNIPYIIKAAKKWPHLNPTMFVDDANDGNPPIVLNSAMSLGREMVLTAQQSDYGRNVAPVGKYATMLDYAVSCSAAPDISRAEGLGIGSKAFEGYVSDGNSIVYEECPDTPWLMSQPLIDSSDLSQCGFNILISNDDPSPNEWERFLIDKNNYADGAAATNFVGTIAGSSSNAVPVAPAYGSAKQVSDVVVYARAHVTNPTYRAEKEHMLVFVGAGIFNHPWLCGSKKTSGYYCNHLNSDSASVMSNIFKLTIAGESDADWIQDVALWNRMCSEFTAKHSDASNPVDLFAIILGRQIAGNNVNVYDFEFGPDYGPVDICAMIPMTNDRNDTIPKVGSSYAYEGSDKAFTPEFANIDFSAGGTGDINNSVEVTITKPIAYDPILSPLQWLVSFLSSITFPKVKVDSFGGYEASSEINAITVVFSDVSKWMESLTSRIVTQFVGMHDTKPFWSPIDLSAEACAIAASDRFPENNILALPRVVQSQKKNNFKSHVGGKPNDKDEINSITGKSGSSSGKKARTNPSRGGWGRKRSQETRSKGTEVNSDSLPGVSSSSSEIASLGKEGGISDLSDKKDDKSFDRRKRDNMGQDNVLGAI